MRRFWAAVLTILAFQWSLQTDAPAQIMRFMMSTTNAIAQATGTVASGLANQLAYYVANGTTVQGLTIVNNGVPSYDGSGTLAVRTSLPNGLTAASMSLANATSSTQPTCPTNSGSIATTQFAKNCIPQHEAIAWATGANPNGGGNGAMILTHIGQAITIQSIYCRLSTNGDANATLDVYTAPSLTGGTSGTKLTTTSCNLNGAANTDQSLLSAPVNVPAGNSVYAVTAGTVQASAGGVGANYTYQ